MSAWPSLLGNPQFSGYDLESTDPTVRTDMDSGPARVRRRFTSSPDNVSLRFVFNETQMATFRSFWETGFLNGAAWVSMPIKTGVSAGLMPKECRPLTGSFKASPASRTQWVVEFMVEVRNA